MNQIIVGTNRLLLIWSPYEAGEKLCGTRQAVAILEGLWVTDNKDGERAERLQLWALINFIPMMLLGVAAGSRIACRICRGFLLK